MQADSAGRTCLQPPNSAPARAPPLWAHLVSGAARLAADPRLPLGEEVLADILRSARDLTGTAGAQVDRFVERVAIVGAQHPAASAYRPQAIL